MVPLTSNRSKTLQSIIGIGVLKGSHLLLPFGSSSFFVFSNVLASPVSTMISSKGVGGLVDDSFKLPHHQRLRACFFPLPMVRGYVIFPAAL